MTTPPPPPDREQIAQADVAATVLAPALAPLLVAALFLPIVTVALVQILAGGFRTAAQALPTPSALTAARRAEGLRATNRLLTSGLHRFELALEETSPVLAATQPTVQWVMTTLLATGNPRVVVGRESWLFFRPDVDHLTGPPFLARMSGNPWRGIVRPWASEPADSDADLSAFADLRAHGMQGMQLVVVLAPSKAAIHPEKLNPRLQGSAPLANRSLPALGDRLRAAGITFLDPSSLLATAASADGVAQYLATDTHWTPAAMERVAAIAADAVRHLLSPQPATAAPIYVREAATATNTGDLARMLRLPRERDPYPAETVALDRVVDREGGAWEPDPEAEILVLGDSFTLLYSDAAMGWGSSAGFAEQLAFHLQRPVDRIALNAGGTVRALTTGIPGQRDRLAGKRVVIYELAARFLTGAGDAEPR